MLEGEDEDVQLACAAGVPQAPSPLNKREQGGEDFGERHTAQSSGNSRGRGHLARVSTKA
jgi:hypothetical protein